MDISQNKDLVIKFDNICRQLKDTGIDLSGVKITTTKTHNTSYLTKRILEETRILSNEN